MHFPSREINTEILIQNDCSEEEDVLTALPALELAGEQLTSLDSIELTDSRPDSSLTQFLKMSAT